MGLVIPDTYASAAFVLTEGGIDVGTEPYIWTMGVSLATASGSTTDQANGLFDAWTSNWNSITFVGLSMERVDLTVPAPGGGTGVVSSTNDAVEGLRSGDINFSALAPKIRKLTDLPGRKYRGLFHPAGTLSVSDVNGDGSLTSGAISDHQDVLAAFAEDVDALNIGAVILHSDPLITPTPVVGFATQAKVGVLRHRLI